MKTRIARAQSLYVKILDWIVLEKMVKEKHFENNAGKKKENMNSNLTSKI